MQCVPRSKRSWFWTVASSKRFVVIFSSLFLEVFSFLARCSGLHWNTFTTALCNLRTQSRTSATLAHQNDQFSFSCNSWSFSILYKYNQIYMQKCKTRAKKQKLVRRYFYNNLLTYNNENYLLIISYSLTYNI